MKINLSEAENIACITGFGASSCWWSTALGDEKTAQEVINLLYGGNGLKMNIYRYNCGGGYEKDNVRIDNPWRRIESFMNRDGSFNWNADKNAVAVMDKALETGNVDTLIFFANSPHFTQTVTGQTSGGFTEHFSNLAKDKYGAFAKYLIDIAEHFIDMGYPVKYISPINEPQWKWGGGYVWQEGCHYEPQEVKECFLTFARELDRRNSPLLLYGAESGNISEQTREYYRLFESEPLIMKHLGAYAYHSYGSDNDVKNKKDFGKWAAENIKTPRFDMSEWCELPCRHDIKSIKSALITARIIGEDLIYSKAQSWTAWVCANQWENAVRDGKCYSDGLLAAKDDWSDYCVTMRYYAMAHYSKYIPVNSVSLDIDYDTSRGLSIFAFKTPQGETVLVAVNDSRAKRVIEPDIRFKSGKAFVTCAEYQLRELKINPSKISIAPESIATVILK